MSMQPDRLREQLRALRLFGPLELTFDDGFRNTRDIVLELLRAEHSVTLFVCSGYADRDGAPLLIPELETDDPTAVEQLRTFTWDELRQLAAAGAKIAAHTVTHAHLPEISDVDLAREVQDSKRRIEEEVDRPCVDFAYPYGEHDERVRAAVRAAGYERAYSLRSSAGEMALPRLDLYQRDASAGTLLKAVKFRLSSLGRVMPKEAVRTP